MTLTAPYNFVPVSETVCSAVDLGLPEGLPSQDDPATGGLCGEIGVTLTAHFPILVAGGQDGQKKKFFKTPSGDAIQGSTIRGMIRNVIEIAAFGKMWRVENRRFGMRDLTPGARVDYGNRMSKNRGSDTYEARARGGWLTETSAGLFLEEVDYGRIEHSELFGARSPNKPTAKELEAQYNGVNPRPVHIEVELNTHQHSEIKDRNKNPFNPPRWKKLVYRKAYTTIDVATKDDKVVRTGDLNEVNAQIVFTGMPSASKHMEFAFPQSSGPGSGVEVSPQVWGKFIDVHENLEKASPTWEWRRTTLRKGKPIPVFFLLKDGKSDFTTDSLDQIGLSMMFKMAGDNTAHLMMPSAHLKEDLIDLPTRMFGRINKDHGSFRGRLSFGIMEKTCATGLEFPDGKSLILSSPKPSYFPSYVRQRDLANNTGLHRQAQYRSYMNWKHADGSAGGPDAIRGWKRYPIPNHEPDLDPVTSTGKSASHLFPLKAGATFTGTIRFHNLHAVELSALLWALQWGGDASCFHSVGMGKPFGWGQSTLNIDRLKIDYKQVGLADYAGQFTKAMTGKIPDWENTPQIKSLLAMAQAEHGKGMIGQMAVDGFRDAKKNREILPDIECSPSELGIQAINAQSESRIKRELTPQESQALTEREEEIEKAAAASDVVWMKKGDIVKATLEIDGRDYRVTGEVRVDQTTEYGRFKVFFGLKIGFRDLRRSDLEIAQ